MQNIINNGKLPIIPSIRQLVTALNIRTTDRHALRGFAGSINARICVTIAALTALIALFIPWVILDGHATPLSGFTLMTYALQEGNDRWVMWQISPGATVLMLTVPFGITATVCWTAFTVLRRNYRLDVPLFTLAGILALLRFTPPILDGRMYTLGSFAVPGPGLFILLLATLAVIAINSGAALRRWRLPAQS